MKLPIYLDYHATTPVDPRVLEAMRPYFTEWFGNAASAQHAFGWQAEAAVKKARTQIAQLLHADAREIYFTSGVTESNNWALRGIAEAYREQGNHIVTVVTEHKSVLEPAQALTRRGFRVTVLLVDSCGLVSLTELERALTPRTILISVMAANNEIGTIAPLVEIGKIAKRHGVLFHTDAAQALAKIPLDVAAMGIDLLSAGAHKMYGPKGIGMLYIRRTPKSGKNLRVKIPPLLYGGGQEGGLRGGTLNVPGIVGFGEACELAGQEMVAEQGRILQLRERLYTGLSQGLRDIELNGPATNRLAGNLNLSFMGVKADALMGALYDVAVSSGSACTSGSSEPSYVIRALGVGEERAPLGRARTSIRFGLGRFTTEEEIDHTVQRVIEVVKKLR